MCNFNFNYYSHYFASSFNLNFNNENKNLFENSNLRFEKLFRNNNESLDVYEKILIVVANDFF